MEVTLETSSEKPSELTKEVGQDFSEVRYDGKSSRMGSESMSTETDPSVLWRQVTYSLWARPKWLTYGIKGPNTGPADLVGQPTDI